ncbi:MAG: FAD:protein FMN transferase [Proteobacteria bacterium]|nr:FAD:protein FMN transferase [Pseudomonadota bacterium]
MVLDQAHQQLNAQPVHDRIMRSARWSSKKLARRLDFFAMGTHCKIVFQATQETGRAFGQDALEWVADFEARYSRFIDSSLISRINAQAGKDWVSVDPETETLLNLCQEAHFLSRGVFDPTTLPLSRLWKWNATTPTIPTETQIQEAREKVGWTRVQRRPGSVFLPVPGMCLDFGGIGKEYAVDYVAGLARTHGIDDVLVDFGQDLYASGTPFDGRPAWHIGLEDPDCPGQCWTGVGIRNVAVATSGDYLRCFEIDGKRYGHILDGRTGYPVANGCRAVTIIAPRCTIAGLLSTTLLVLGPEDGMRMLDSMYQIEGCILTDKAKLFSRNFHEYVTS